MTIRHVVYNLAHDYPGKGIQLGKDMGRKDSQLKVFQNKLNPNSTTHFLSIDELEVVADFANGNIAVAEYFAEKVNAVVFKLPDIPDMSDMALLDGFMQSMAALGQLSAEFQADYADGDIDKTEFKRIEQKVDQVIARLLEFKSSVKRVVR